MELKNSNEELNNSDLISRQAAIDVTWEEPTYTDPLNVLTEVRDKIRALPSTHPEPSQVARDIATIIENEMDMRVMLSQPEIVRCKDCKHYDEVNQPYPQMYCRKHSIDTSDQDFCSRAERKDDV